MCELCMDEYVNVWRIPIKCAEKQNNVMTEHPKELFEINCANDLKHQTSFEPIHMNALNTEQWALSAVCIV